MKKTIAVLGSAAALTFAGAGLAAADEGGANDQQGPGNSEGNSGGEDSNGTSNEVAGIVKQLCGTIDAYDFLGSAEGVVPGLSGEECEANADAAVAAAMSGNISAALDIIRGIDAGAPGEEENGDADATGGSAQLLGSLTGSDDAESDPDLEGATAAFGS